MLKIIKMLFVFTYAFSACSMNYNSESLKDICSDYLIKSNRLSEVQKLNIPDELKVYIIDKFQGLSLSAKQDIMMSALLSNNEDLACFIISLGLNPNHFAYRGRHVGLLNYASLHNLIDLTNCLIKNGAEVNSTRSGHDGKDECPALEKAITTKNYEIAKILLDNGANVDSRYFCKETVLSIAISRGDIEAVRLFLDYNASIEIKSGNYDHINDPVIFVAICNKGHAEPKIQKTALEIVKLLIKKGADINRLSWFAGRTPLIQACVVGSTEIVELLLKHGAKMDVQDMWGDTALSIAKFYNHKEIVKLLRKYKLANCCCS